jgi:hypothetical protein
LLKLKLIKLENFHCNGNQQSNNFSIRNQHPPAAFFFLGAVTALGAVGAGVVTAPDIGARVPPPNAPPAAFLKSYLASSSSAAETGG